MKKTARRLELEREAAYATLQASEKDEKPRLYIRYIAAMIRVNESCAEYWSAHDTQIQAYYSREAYIHERMITAAKTMKMYMEGRWAT